MSMAKPFNIRCNRFYIGEALQPCDECSCESIAYTFLMPSGWEALITSESGGRRRAGMDAGCVGHWLRVETEAFPVYVTAVSDVVAEALQEHSALRGHRRLFFPARHPAPGGGSYPPTFTNHCGECGARLPHGHELDEHVFQPYTPDEAAAIELFFFNRPFLAHCNFVDDAESVRRVFPHMRRHCDPRRYLSST